MAPFACTSILFRQTPRDMSPSSIRELSRLNCPGISIGTRAIVRPLPARLRPRMVMNGPQLAGLLAVVAPYHATDFFHYGKLGPNATSTRRSRLHRSHWRRKEGETEDTCTFAAKSSLSGYARISQILEEI